MMISDLLGIIDISKNTLENSDYEETILLMTYSKIFYLKLKY